MKSCSRLGKFIVIEGIDGAGGETQTNFLVRYLKSQKKKVEKITYPDYKGKIGKLIHYFLHEKTELCAEVETLLYFADFVKDKAKILKWLSEGKIVVADRYFTSTIAYQKQKGVSLNLLKKMFSLFELPRPDLVIYLKISPETSLKRKYKEKKNLDRHEKNEKFLKKVAREYEKISKYKNFGKWIIVDGEKSKKEVFEAIKKVVLKVI